MSDLINKIIAKYGLELVMIKPPNKPIHKTIFKWAFLIDYFLLLILLIIYIYFSFSSIVQLTVYSILYEWILLFSKEKYDMIVSVFVNLTNFGSEFALFLLCIYVIKDFFSIVVSSVKFLYFIFNGKKDDTDYSNETEILKTIIDVDILTIESLNSKLVGYVGKQIFCFLSVISKPEIVKVGSMTFTIIKIPYILANTIIFIVILIINGVLIFLLTDQMYIAWVSIVIECFILLFIFVALPFSSNINEYRKNRITFSSISANENDSNYNNNNEEEDIGNSDNDDDDVEDIGNSNNEVVQNSNQNDIDIDNVGGIFVVLKISYYKGILNDGKFTIGKLIVGIILGLFQLYSVIYPFVMKNYKVGNFILYLIVKICLFGKNLCYNIIYGIITPKKILSTLSDMPAKIVHCIMLALYFILIILFILLYFILGKNVFPNVNNAIYIEDNSKWFKVNSEKAYYPEGYCYTYAKNDGSLKTEDFAMLTTLPRLYNVQKNGKCYIKPSMRGLFNTTMKYIFGYDYEKQGIEIFCKKFTNYITLIIRSEKILNQTINEYSTNGNIILFDKQFDIHNKDYFEDQNYIENLSNDGKKLINLYQECVSNNRNDNCDDKWDKFAQYYLPNTFTDDYVDIPGFERYQMTFDSKTIIQPSFMTSKGQLMSGTHYIVGSSYENRQGIGLFFETIAKKYVPSIFENFILFYSLIHGLLGDIFIKFNWFNSKLIYLTSIAIKDMSSYTDLYSQFNFSQEALFSIGHSVSGTEMKGVASHTQIQGITFDSTTAEFLGSFKINSNFKTSSSGTYQITNVFSANNYFSSFDENCYSNGMLPKRYHFPNVYDTACMTAISCSETMKYVSFCKQVLNKNERKSIQEFNKSLDAYIEHYGLINN